MKKIKMAVCIMVLFSLITTIFSSGISNAASAVTVTVTSTAKQTFLGFGAAQPWAWQYLKGDDSTAKTNIYNAMFTDLKLKYLRFDLDPIFQSSDGSSYDIVSAVQNSGQKEIIDNARSRTGNAINLTYSVWTPPYWMKQNNSRTGGDSYNYLRSDKVDAYATYLSEFLSKFKSTYGFPVNWLSIQNEPTNNTPYDSCTYSATSYYQTLIAVKNKMNSYGNTDTKLFSAETSWPDTTYYQTVIDNAYNYLDAGCVHTYDSDLSYYNQTLRTSKPMHMTENSKMTSTDPGASYASWLGGQFSKDVKNDAVSWYWWLLSAPQDTNQGEALIVTNGKRFTTPVTPFTSYTLTKKYYAFKQMTNTISQNAVYRDTTSTDVNISAAGFKNSNGKFTALVTNTSSTGTFNVTVKFSELSTVSGNWTKFVTDANNNMVSSNVRFTNGSYYATIAPNTVVSFVQQ